MRNLTNAHEPGSKLGGLNLLAELTENNSHLPDGSPRTRKAPARPVTLERGAEALSRARET